jgi:hypothetical protein
MNATTFHFAGGFHPSLLPFQQALLGVAFLLAVLALLDRHVPRWISLPSLALLVTAPWFWWRLQSILPDQTLGYLIAAAALTSLLWLVEQRLAWLALALVFLMAASLVKLEGSLFGTLLVVVVLVAGFALHRRAARPGLLLVLGPAGIVPWHLWLVHHGLRASASDYSVTDLLRPSYLADRTFRLHHALNALRGAGGDAQAGAIMYLSFVVLLVVASRIPVITAAVAAWLALALFGLASIYWIGRPNIDAYLEVSVTRVGATIIIVAATLTPLLLGLGLKPRPQPPAAVSVGDAPSASA